MSSAGVVVHINEELNQVNREELSQKVGELDGVLSTNLEEQRPHLMIVDYDPSLTRSQDVLSEVNNAGVHAQLVGWV